MNGLRSHIKHMEECFIRYPNTSKSVKKTRLRLVFSTHFSVFGYPDETLFLVFEFLEAFNQPYSYCNWDKTGAPNKICFIVFSACFRVFNFEVILVLKKLTHVDLFEFCNWKFQSQNWNARERNFIPRFPSCCWHSENDSWPYFALSTTYLGLWKRKELIFPRYGSLRWPLDREKSKRSSELMRRLMLSEQIILHWSDPLSAPDMN